MLQLTGVIYFAYMGARKS